MNTHKTTKTVREPVQVYLAESDRSALDRVAIVTGLPRAEVLRRGLRRFAAEVLAEESPALAFLADAMGAAPQTSDSHAAENHDQVLADLERESWAPALAEAKSRRTKR